MLTISKSKLKANMLSVFRDLERSGEEAVVTDRGKPVLRISPYREEPRTLKEMFADIRGKAVFNEDPDEPTTSEWKET